MFHDVLGFFDQHQFFIHPFAPPSLRICHFPFGDYPVFCAQISIYHYTNKTNLSMLSRNGGRWYSNISCYLFGSPYQQNKS